MNVCMPVAADGTVDPRFGRTARVAVAAVTDDALTDWQEFDVHWNVADDEGSEGAHHIRVILDCAGDARHVVLSKLATASH